MKRISKEEEEETSAPLLYQRIMKDNSDPFYGVRDNINAQVEKIKLRYEKFQDLVKNSDTSTNVEFKELRKGLVRELRAVDKDFKGLKGAVDMVDKNRSKFPLIKDGELASRKKFVDDMEVVIQEVKGGIDSPAVRRKIEDDENKARRDQGDASTNILQQRVEKENDRFIGDHKQQMKQVIEVQDQNLEHLDKGVSRLGEMAKDINTELKTQNHMLDGLEKDMDHANEKMNVVQEALGKLLKTKDGCQIWTIVILAGILILLVALIIWLP